MHVEIPDEYDVVEQAATAGFASVAEYLAMLLRRDADRVAIQKGLESARAGRVRPLAELDREFRQQNGMQSRP